MNCKLCSQEIEDYVAELNHLKIDDGLEVDLCQRCIDRFIKWQGKIFLRLFPTKAAKNMQKWKD